MGCSVKRGPLRSQIPVLMIYSLSAAALNVAACKILLMFYYTVAGLSSAVLKRFCFSCSRIDRGIWITTSAFEISGCKVLQGSNLSYLLCQEVWLFGSLCALVIWSSLLHAQECMPKLSAGAKQIISSRTKI